MNREEFDKKWAQVIAKCWMDPAFKEKVLKNPTETLKEYDIEAPANMNFEVEENSDKIIHLLNDYARELTDPSKTLKNIEPLVESIRKEVSLIEAKTADKTHDDTELERFVKDLAVTANVAVFKFYRGDYI